MSRPLLRSAFFAAVVVGCSGVEQGSAPPPADLVLRNGGIYTVGAQRAWARAVAIREGIVVALGDDAAIEPYVGPATRVVDLTGRMALPGLEKSNSAIATGKRADIVVLDRNLFEIPPEQIADAKVVLTIMNGEVIYERASSGGAAPRGGAGFAHWR